MCLPLIAALVWSSYASALSFPLVQRDVPAVMSLELHRSLSASPSLQQRDSSYTMYGSVVGDYWLEVAVGTPPQQINVSIEIKASMVGLLAADSDGEGNASACGEYHYCPELGYYKPGESSTVGSGTFPFYYGSDVAGWGTANFSTDTITIGGTRAKDIPIYYIDVEPSSFSRMGLSPTNTSFPYLLVDRGLIRSPSFSVWGNKTVDGPGGLIFGGVNTAKYHGQLQAFSFNETSPTVTIPMSGFQVQTDDGTPSNYTTGTRVELEIRYITTYLPPDAVHQMYRDYNISSVYHEAGNFSVPQLECSRQYTENRYVSVVLGNTTISVHWSEFFTPSPIYPDACHFLIEPVVDYYDVPGYFYGRIGSIFVHHMYMALDYNSHFVGVAALNESPGPDNILEIGSGPEIPDAVGDFPTSVVPYSPRPTVTPTTTATSTSTARAAMPTMPPSYRPGAVAGIAGVALLAVC